MFTARYVLHSRFCPLSVFTCFVWIWEQTAIFSLHTIEWFALVMVKHCVLCEGESETFTLCTDAQTQTLSSVFIVLHTPVPHASQSHSTSTLYRHQSPHLSLPLRFLPDGCPAHDLRHCCTDGRHRGLPLPARFDWNRICQTMTQYLRIDLSKGPTYERFNLNKEAQPVF